MGKVPDAVSKRYPMRRHWSAEDVGWIATFPDLPGCSAWGASEAEALTESQAAAAAWLKACKVAGNPIPAPSPLADDADYSGRLVMRIPKRRHADLAKSAKRQGVGLNQYALYLLTARASAGGEAHT